MIAHSHDATNSSFTSPPPPPPKDVSNRTSVSTVTNTSKSPSRIKRKPLPPTAFSPLSAVPSPDSIYSRYVESTRSIEAPTSAIALNQILDNHTIQPQLVEILLPEEKSFGSTNDSGVPPVPAKDNHEVSHTISINDFPVPPRSGLGNQRASDEDQTLRSTHEAGMGAKTNGRPPPLRMDALRAVKAIDAKKPQSPGSVFTSFFSRKQNISPHVASPGDESSITDISEGRSAGPSPHLDSNEESSTFFMQPSQVVLDGQRNVSSQSSMDSNQLGNTRRVDYTSLDPSDVMSRCNSLEAELREISRELAGSIRRELDLEDLVDRLQMDAPPAPMSVDRTSDYFSDSGTSSVRLQDSVFSSKDEIAKIKRESEQQRAQMRIELSQKWQDEIAGRKLLESQISDLQTRLSHTRRDTNDNSDSSARIRELENTLDDARRRMNEERQTKENFEDLLTAMRVDIEQHRNDRDNLRDEVVPKLRSQIEGLESSLADAQKQTYEYAKMQQEIQTLKDENAAISSARRIEQEMIRNGMDQIAEDDDLSSVRSSLVLPKTAGLNRSNTIAGRTTTRGTLSRSGSLSRANSILNRTSPETPESITDKLNAVEQQRDALQITTKHLRRRLEHESKKYEKQIAALRVQVEKTGDNNQGLTRGGYEKEVRTLRQEINLLRKRADEALDQKWQCEKGLAGLKMDLDRSKQETASLQQLLQARDMDDPEVVSSALENAINELQQVRALGSESVGSLQQEQELAQQLEESAERSEALAAQVRLQLEANSSLRTRLIKAVENGEKNQQASATQISQLQSKLKRLEDTITSAQLQSETAVMKHEEDLRILKQSHNIQLQRAKAGLKSPIMNTSATRSPLSPMFTNSKRSPRLDQTSSGPGQTLNQTMKTEFLEKKVTELEKALHDAEHGMEEVVGRMNQAQIGVFELQQERDEALKRTKKLEADVKAERERFQMLVTGGLGVSADDE